MFFLLCLFVDVKDEVWEISENMCITFLNSSYIPHVSCKTELWICIFTCTCFV